MYVIKKRETCRWSLKLLTYEESYEINSVKVTQEYQIHVQVSKVEKLFRSYLDLRKNFKNKWFVCDNNLERV